MTRANLTCMTFWTPPQGYKTPAGWPRPGALLPFSHTAVSLHILHIINTNKMPLFRRHARSASTTRRHRGPSRFRLPGQKHPDRVAAGFSELRAASVQVSSESHVIYFQEAALSNPNTTREGRQHAKHELRLMVRIPCGAVPEERCVDRTSFYRVGTKTLTFPL